MKRLIMLALSLVLSAELQAADYMLQAEGQTNYENITSAKWQNGSLRVSLQGNKNAIVISAGEEGGIKYASVRISFVQGAQGSGSETYSTFHYGFLDPELADLIRASKMQVGDHNAVFAPDDYSGNPLDLPIAIHCQDRPWRCKIMINMPDEKRL